MPWVRSAFGNCFFFITIYVEWIAGWLGWALNAVYEEQQFQIRSKGSEDFQLWKVSLNSGEYTSQPAHLLMSGTFIILHFTACTKSTKVKIWVFWDFWRAHLPQSVGSHCLACAKKCSVIHKNTIFIQKASSFLGAVHNDIQTFKPSQTIPISPPFPISSCHFSAPCPPQSSCHHLSYFGRPRE